jgi:hypothetical protein
MFCEAKPEAIPEGGLNMGRTFVNEPRQSVPPGTFDVELFATEDREPYSGPSKWKRTNPNEPRMAWQYRILAGEHAGQVIEQITGTVMGGPKSNLAKLLVMMLGRPLGKGESVNEDYFLGSRFRVVWSINVESEQGFCHISSMTLLSKPASVNPQPAANAAAPASTNGPPPPPPDAAGTPEKAPEEVFWIVLAPGEGPVMRDRTAIEKHMEENKIDPNKLKLSLVGTKEWVTAASFNFPDPVKF